MLKAEPKLLCKEEFNFLLSQQEEQGNFLLQFVSVNQLS